MVVETSSIVETLKARGVAYALVARLLSSDTRLLAEGDALDTLREAVDAAGSPRASARLDARELAAGEFDARPLGAAAPDAGELSRRWVRWFDQGRVAPYECSNTPPTAGGHTARLADVAGFYRAFGMTVAGDRPDHVVAELEFASLVSLAEASALERDDADQAEVAAGAARAFLRDHLGTWLDAWAARVGDVDELRPWAPVAAVAADLVSADCAQRNVVPVRPFAVLSGDAGLPADDEEDLLPVCGADEPDFSG